MTSNKLLNGRDNKCQHGIMAVLCKIITYKIFNVSVLFLDESYTLLNFSIEKHAFFLYFSTVVNIFRSVNQSEKSFSIRRKYIIFACIRLLLKFHRAKFRGFLISTRCIV